MTMTKPQIVQHSEAYVDWWKQRGMDMAACLTIDPKKWYPKHHSQVVKAVKAAFKKVGYEGSLDGVAEQGADGIWHAHVVFQSGLIDPERLRSHWYLKHGKAMVRRAGSRSCTDCEDRTNCTWKKFSVRGCGDLAYTGRKMHRDRRDGGAIINL